jgi:hypothetical protein
LGSIGAGRVGAIYRPVPRLQTAQGQTPGQDLIESTIVAESITQVIKIIARQKQECLAVDRLGFDNRELDACLCPGGLMS